MLMEQLPSEASFLFLVTTLKSLLSFGVTWLGTENNRITSFMFESLAIYVLWQENNCEIPRKNLKRTISASGGLGLLQMVSEPDIGQCASEDAEPRRGVDCEIPHRLERRTKHSL